MSMMPRLGAPRLHSVKRRWRRTALRRNFLISHGANGSDIQILPGLPCKRKSHPSEGWSEEPAMIESAPRESPGGEAPVIGPEGKAEGAARLGSLDAFRGLVMVLMLAEHLRLPEVARAFPHSLFWRVIG